MPFYFLRCGISRKSLIEDGFDVVYTKLDDPLNKRKFIDEIQRAIGFYDAEKIVVTSPGEYRLLENFETWEKLFGVPVVILEDDRFFVFNAKFS